MEGLTKNISDQHYWPTVTNEITSEMRWKETKKIFQWVHAGDITSCLKYIRYNKNNYIHSHHTVAWNFQNRLASVHLYKTITKGIPYFKYHSDIVQSSTRIFVVLHNGSSVAFSFLHIVWQYWQRKQYKLIGMPFCQVSTTSPCSWTLLWSWTGVTSLRGRSS